MKCLFMKIGDGLLMSADEEARHFLERHPIGDGFSVEITKTRNIRFHRKFFALLRLAFDAWDTDEAFKNFDRFRQDITILAGFYEVVATMDGGVSPVAKSLAFSKMDDGAFAEVYRKVLDVVWDKILRHSRYKSQQEVDDVVEKLLVFS